MSSKSSRKKKNINTQNSPSQQTLAKWLSKSPKTQNLKVVNASKAHFKKENQLNNTEESPFASSQKNKTKKNKMNTFNSSNHELPSFPMVKSAKQTNECTNMCSQYTRTLETKERSCHDSDIIKKEIHRYEYGSSSSDAKANCPKQRKNKNVTKKCHRPEPSCNTIIHNGEETVDEASTNKFRIYDNSESDELTTCISITKRMDQTENKTTTKKRHRRNSPNTTQNSIDTNKKGFTFHRFNSGSSLQLPSFQALSPKDSNDEDRKLLSDTSSWPTTKKLKTDKTVTKKPREEKLQKPALNIFTQKKTSTKTLTRINSASSDELPTFRERVPRKRSKKTETFKKYGVIVPPIDEIIADQQHLSNYKRQVEEARALSEYSFAMPCSPKKVKIEEQILDCKHLTVENIERHFNDNASFLSDIMNGKKFSNRHRRYYDKKNLLDNLTMKDLAYNTSTIVFTFEQLDHMVTLMQEQFDPDDQKTCYFFKVLVPELCLKIFMDTYNMNKREANDYLDNRPV